MNQEEYADPMYHSALHKAFENWARIIHGYNFDLEWRAGYLSHETNIAWHGFKAGFELGKAYPK